MLSSPSSAILIASEEPSLADEVLRYLEEKTPRPKVVTVDTLPELVTALSDQPLRAVLLSASLAQALARNGASPPPACPIVLGREERMNVLRAALEIGARGFVRWPEDRLELLRLLEEAPSGEPASGRGLVIAVWSPKGGSGTSVLAAHLAWGLSSRAKSCLLVDLDLDHGDQTMILGAEPKTSIFDLIPVSGEMTPAALERLVWGHPLGFRAILLPKPGPDSSADVSADITSLAPALQAIRKLMDALVLDIPSGLGGLPLLLALEGVRVVLVVTADLLALHRSRQAMRALIAAGIERERIHPILNRGEDAEIQATDVEAVLGCRLAATIPFDAGIRRAPDIGRLSPSGRDLLDGLVQRIAGPSERPSKRRRFFGERVDSGRGS